MSKNPPLGQQLREARQAAGLTQADLAEKIGTAQSFISAIERGVKRPTVDTMAALA